MLSFQVMNKPYRPLGSKNFLLQKVGTKFYIEQDADPDPHFFRGRSPDPVFFKGRVRIRSKIFWISNTEEKYQHLFPSSLQ
jgi:hypothetical protein